jgi:kynurenine formamidase
LFLICIRVGSSLLRGTSAVIFECLDLSVVPKGKYLFMGFPLPLAGASESPVCPVLFKKGELNF